MITVAPTALEGGERLPIVGVSTMNMTLELLGMEFSTTVTGPVVTLLGAVAVMLVLVQFVTVAATPLKLMVLLPWVFPRCAANWVSRWLRCKSLMFHSNRPRPLYAHCCDDSGRFFHAATNTATKSPMKMSWPHVGRDHPNT